MKRGFKLELEMTNCGQSTDASVPIRSLYFFSFL